MMSLKKRNIVIISFFFFLGCQEQNPKDQAKKLTRGIYITMIDCFTYEGNSRGIKLYRDGTFIYADDKDYKNYDIFTRGFNSYYKGKINKFSFQKKILEYESIQKDCSIEDTTVIEIGWTPKYYLVLHFSNYEKQYFRYSRLNKKCLIFLEDLFQTPLKQNIKKELINEYVLFESSKLVLNPLPPISDDSSFITN